ncbi:uncharacterized protein LOC135499824 isoform X2 [Lineus longissimus]|uniref:uncharacterized protein LOC135499824 isoform X2 n=1 Tax=Lineus longissimus TaxID=88925 RepID=UPI00315D0034
MSESEDSSEDEVCRLAQSLIEAIMGAVLNDDQLEQVAMLQTYDDFDDDDDDDDDRFAKLAVAVKSAGESRKATIVGRLLDFCPDQEEMRKTCTGELVTACKNLRVPFIEVLLLHGVDPYTRHKMYLDGSLKMQDISPVEMSLTQFYRASENGLDTTDHVKIINLFLDKKEISTANQSDRKFKGPTALLAAVVAGRFDEAKEIVINRGVDVNSAVVLGDFGMKFPLGEACRQRDVAFFKFLLSIGADPYAETLVRNPSMFEYDKVPIIIVEAISTSNIEMIKIILDFDDALTKPNHIRSVALFAAFIVGDSAKQKLLAKWCIKEDADFIDTQLFLAIREENIERVKMLLPYVMDINRNLRYGEAYLCTSLEAAVRSNKRTDICDLLIEKGAKVNLVSVYPAQSGFSPLMIACIYNRRMVPYLLRKGADVNLRCNNGTTPLDDLEAHIMSVEYHDDVDYLRCVCLLLREGAKPSASAANLLLIVFQEIMWPPMRDNLRSIDKDFFSGIRERLGYIDFLADQPKRPISRERMTDSENLELVKTLVETGSLSWRLIGEIYQNIKDPSHAMKCKAVEEYLEEFLANGYTLKEMCRLKIREVMRPPLRASVTSNDLEYPTQLKKYILFQGTQDKSCMPE